MLEGLTPTHLILVLVIALVIFGPGKLPEAGAALGKAIRGFRDAASGKVEPPTTSAVAPTPATDQSSAPLEGQHPGTPTVPPGV